MVRRLLLRAFQVLWDSRCCGHSGHVGSTISDSLSTKPAFCGTFLTPATKRPPSGFRTLSLSGADTRGSSLPASVKVCVEYHPTCVSASFCVSVASYHAQTHVKRGGPGSGHWEGKGGQRSVGRARHQPSVTEKQGKPGWPGPRRAQETRRMKSPSLCWDVNSDPLRGHVGKAPLEDLAKNLALKSPAPATLS